jgi:hypothetical protein
MYRKILYFCFNRKHLATLIVAFCYILYIYFLKYYQYTYLVLIVLLFYPLRVLITVCLKSNNIPTKYTHRIRATCTHIHLTHILTKYIIYKLNFAYIFSYLYLFILLFDHMVGIQLDNAYAQRTHVLLECMNGDLDYTGLQK